MRRRAGILRSALLQAALLLPLAFAARAQGQLTTGTTGGGQPYTNMQPSLGLNYIVRTEGNFNRLAEVRLFAGNFAPGGFALADGRELPIIDYEPLFNLIGTTYGGDGQTTFALPDLRGRAVMGEAQGPGLSNWALGDRTGSEATFLQTLHLPPHTHNLPPSPFNTGVAGGGQPHNTMQPTAALNYTVALQGVFPGRETGTDGETFVGQIGMTARSSANLPNGLAPARGQLLAINPNQALFAILGTTFGGNGQNNFALPDLRGRVAIGDGAAPGLTPRQLGEQLGAETVTLTEAQMPSHSHTLPPAPVTTGDTGGGQPHSTMQPTLAVKYFIAAQGVFPPREGSGSDQTYVGEIHMFAGNYVPAGFLPAEGQLLQIGQNTALFSLLGTTFGGNGVSNFALPDLRGRTGIHFGQGSGLSDRLLGEQVGVESFTLTAAELPPHSHSAIPEPAAGLLALVGAAGLAMRRRPRLHPLLPSPCRGLGN